MWEDEFDDQQVDLSKLPDNIDLSGLPDQDEESSLLDKFINPLTTLPSRIGKNISDLITEPTLASSPTGEGGFGDFFKTNILAPARGFYGGIHEGLGNLISEATAPVNAIPMAFSGGSSLAARKGLSTLAKGLTLGEKFTSAPTAGHGLYETFRPDASMSERAMGLAEIGGGILGMNAKVPQIGKQITGEIPPEIPGNIFPDDIPVRRAADTNINGEKPKLRLNLDGTYSPQDNPNIKINVKTGTIRIGDESLTSSKSTDDINEPSFMRDKVSNFDDYVERQLMKVKDIDEALDNFNHWDVELDYAKKGGNSDEIERTGFYRDVALDKYRQLKGTNKSSEMRVPKTKNIAMGGADPEVLDVLGTALYAKGGPSTVVKELFQNAADERKLSGTNEPIKIAFRYSPSHPQTGVRSNSVVVKDYGRGMTANDLYTIFSDVGKSGKRGESGASGGFGFAKAAPFLGGNYMRVESITIENGQTVRHTFEGNPQQFKNQKVGVPVNTEIVPDNTPTGFKVETFFPENQSLYDADKLLKHTVENSPGLTGIQTYNDYHSTDEYLNKFLKGEPDKYDADYIENLQGKNIPAQVDTISLPEADIDIHYELDNLERRNAKLVLLNNGLYALNKNVYFGQHDVPHVPGRIIANIRSKIAEGKEGYPFTANREAVSEKLSDAISEWITENITKGAEKRRISELQEVFDGLTPRYGNKFVILDSGSRYTPQELFNLNASSAMNTISDTMGKMLEELGQMFVFEALGTTEKYGFNIVEHTKGGINIPSPKDGGKFAVLINPLGAAILHADSPLNAAQRIVHTILHEFTHNLARSEGGEYTWKLSQVYSRFDLEKQLHARNKILNSIIGPDGNYAPEFQKLLQEYTTSRGRSETTPDLLGREAESSYIAQQGPKGTSGGSGPDGTGTTVGQTILVRSNTLTPQILKQLREGGFEFVEMTGDGKFRFRQTGQGGPQPILETEIGNSQPTRARAAAGGNIGGNAIPPTNNTGGTGGNIPPPSGGQTSGGRRRHPFVEAYNLPRGLMASIDFSAPLRQGLPLIHKKEFWTSLDDMFRAFGSEAAYEQIQNEIKQRPLFRSRQGPRGRVLPSFAEQAGLKLTDLTDLSSREENIMSTWAEKVPGVRRSNRAYTVFLNKLRADTFESLVRNGSVFGADAQVNIPLARSLADFVNTSTGRGHLSKLESSAVVLNSFLFSPRLMASRLRMLDPRRYIFGDPFVRREALKSLFAVAAVGNTVGQLISMSGGEVNNDPNSADFGKARIGDTRIDPWGGFQQYIVAANRLLRPGFAGVGEPTQSGAVPLDLATGMAAKGGQSITSSRSGKEYDLWNQKGPYDPTHMDAVLRFTRGKIHPVLGFAWSLFNRRKEMSGKDMNFSTVNPMENSISQRFIPIIMQDIYELAQTDPYLLPLAVPASFGMGIQSYDPEE